MESTTTEQIHARRALARALSDRRRARFTANHHARAAARLADLGGDLTLADLAAIGRDLVAAERSELAVQRATAEFHRVHPGA
jgi:hypothetical protein